MSFADVLAATYAEFEANASGKSSEDILLYHVSKTLGLGGAGGGASTYASLSDRPSDFKTVAQLRGGTGFRPLVYVTDPGRQGYFEKDATDTTTADNGGTVLVDSAGQRYKRSGIDFVNPDWFGAVPGAVTDSTAAFQAAIDYAASTTRKVVLVPGYYLISATINVPEAVKLMGFGWRSEWSGFKAAASLTGTLFNTADSVIFADFGILSLNRSTGRFTHKAINTPTASKLMGFGWRSEWSGFKAAASLTGTLFNTADSVIFADFGILSLNRSTGRFTHKAINTPTGSRWNRFYNIQVLGFDVGAQIKGYYHEFHGCHFTLCNDNVHLISTALDTGDAKFFGGQNTYATRHGVNNEVATNTLLEGVTFEGNTYHIYNNNGTGVAQYCYLGDDPTKSIINAGSLAGFHQVNTQDKPIHGGGGGVGGKIAAGESPLTNYISAAVEVAGGRMKVDGGSLDNCIFAGRGFDSIAPYDAPGVFTQKLGSALIVSAGSLEVTNLRTNVVSPIDITGGSIVFRDVANNYVVGGNIDDAARLPFDFNLTDVVQSASAIRTPWGQKIVEFTSPVTLKFRVPNRLVGKVMYVALHHYGVTPSGNNGNTAVLYPTNGNSRNRSSGWTPIVDGSYPTDAMSNLQAGNDWWVTNNPNYGDRYPTMHWLPVTITATSGAFTLLPHAGTSRIGGFFLTEADNFQRIVRFADVHTRRYAAAAPTLGSWSVGDSVWQDEFNAYVNTVAGTPGTWQPGVGTLGAQNATSVLILGGSVTGLSKLDVSAAQSASGGIARGANVGGTLVAAANNDALVGLDITPAFNAGAFTGVSQLPLRVGGNQNYNAQIIRYSTGQNSLWFRNTADNKDLVVGSAATDGGFFVQVGGSVTLKQFSTGNLIVQNGGTFTDAGYRLDVQGTARVSGVATLPSVLVPNASTGLVAHNQSDQTTNYERFSQNWVGNVYTMGTEFGGTASSRAFKMGIAATGGAAINRSITISSATPFISYQWGGTGLAGFGVDVGGGNQLQASSGIQGGLSVTPTVNQSGTAAYRAVFISPFEGTVGSGGRALLEVGTNSAASGAGTHTSRFSVSATGTVTVNGLSGADNRMVIANASGDLSTQAIPGSAFAIATRSGNYTAASGDYTLLCNAASGAFTITLPAAASNSGMYLNLKKIDSSANVVTVDANASETIDGALTKTISTQYASITIHCDGSAWYII